MTTMRAAPISENSFSYRAPVSCMRLAVGITTMSAAPAPETRTKRSRIRRSFSLFSAPPIGMIQPRVSPSGTLLGIHLSAFHHETNGAHSLDVATGIAFHGNEVGQQS